MKPFLQTALVRAFDSGQRYLPLRLVRCATRQPADASIDVDEVVKVEPDLLLRDALYRMNEVFATQAAVVAANGRIIGWLTQDLLVSLFQSDADLALRSPCGELLGKEQATSEAA
ncbi:MAG: hypothetical protein CL583_15145 [Alteromonadaceae bacterium]|nr:hypothetical protein [Alteromonadaceae bacterium]